MLYSRRYLRRLPRKATPRQRSPAATGTVWKSASRLGSTRVQRAVTWPATGPRWVAGSTSFRVDLLRHLPSPAFVRKLLRARGLHVVLAGQRLLVDPFHAG